MKTFQEKLDELWEETRLAVIDKVKQIGVESEHHIFKVIKVENDDLNFNLDSGRWLIEVGEDVIVDSNGFTYGYGVLTHEQMVVVADWVSTVKQSSLKPTEKSLKDIISIIEQSWRIDEYEEDDELLGYEIDTYTNGGVNQIVFLDFRDSEYSPKEPLHFIKILEERIESIDIDEEITLHREMKDYATNFTLKESIKDFEDWKKDLNKLIEKL